MSQQHGNNMYPQTGNGNNQGYDSMPCNCNSQPCPAHPNRMANQPEPITSSGMGITVPFQKADINRNGYDHVNNPNVMSDPSQGPGGHRFNPDNSGPGFNNNSSSNAGPYGNNNMPYNGQYNGSNVPGNNDHYNNNLPGSNGQYNNSNLPGSNGHYNNSNLPGNNGHFNGSNLPGSNGHGSNLPGTNGHYNNNNSNLPGNNGQYGNGAYNGTGAGSNMTGGDHPYNPHNSVMGADEGTILKERIKGGVEKLAGKVTGNPAKVAQGQQRMAAADAAAYHGSRDHTDNRMI